MTDVFEEKQESLCGWSQVHKGDLVRDEVQVEERGWSWMDLLVI